MPSASAISTKHKLRSSRTAKDINRAQPNKQITPAEPSANHNIYPQLTIPSRAEVALLRALTEAAQSRLTFISGARDDMAREDYGRFLDRETYDAWRATMSHSGPKRSFQIVPTFRGASFEQDVDRQLRQLRAVGIEQVAVVDLTKPEFGIPVVRVVIPGLEGLDHSEKFVPGTRAKSLLRERV